MATKNLMNDIIEKIPMSFQQFLIHEGENFLDFLKLWIVVKIHFISYY